jgi:hypothetical protein
MDRVRRTQSIDAAGEERLQKILTELGHGLE